MARYIDANKADKTLHDLLNRIKQEKETAKNEGERKRKSDIAAGIVLAIYALCDEPTELSPEPIKELRSRCISAEAELDRLIAAGIGQAFNLD